MKEGRKVFKWQKNRNDYEHVNLLVFLWQLDRVKKLVGNVTQLLSEY